MSWKQVDESNWLYGTDARRVCRESDQWFAWVARPQTGGAWSRHGFGTAEEAMASADRYADTLTPRFVTQGRRSSDYDPPGVRRSCPDWIDIP